MSKTKIRFLISFFVTLMFSTPILAGMPNTLMGYKLGDPCTKSITVEETDYRIEVQCLGNINKIYEIRVSFKKISYEELLKNTVKSVGAEPSRQTPNKRKVGCQLDPIARAVLGNQKPDPNTWSETGNASWMTVHQTTTTKVPSVELHIWSLLSDGCNEGQEPNVSLIKLRSNKLWEMSYEQRQLNEENKKQETLKKLFD